MDVRKDLQSVSEFISRLLSFSEEFSKCNKDWAHYKNNEDFYLIEKISPEDKYKVERVYSIGRDMALFMKDALEAINFDFSRYPTLTSIIEAFQETWVYGHYDSTVPYTASAICEKYEIRPWSVGQMVCLFKRQERILDAIRLTLDILKSTNLYKLENGIVIMESKSASITVTGVTGSSVNIHSAGASASVRSVQNEIEIFSEIISAIKSAKLNPDEEQNLIDKTNLLATSYKKGSYKEAYKDFMANISSHVTIFSPFIGCLASLL